MEKIRLNDGNTIPQLGLGTWLLKDKCYDTILTALKSGYRHIDSAEIYFNDEAIGKAIKDSKIPRKEIFITTKIWPNNYRKDKLRKSVEKALKQMDIEYLDLVLLHKNIGRYKEAWETLIELKKEGKIKSIGVSSFKKKQLEELINMNSVIPAVNQIECHPFSQREDDIKFMEEHGIRTEAWFPLGHGNKKIMNHPLFVELAKKYNKSPVQIILKWHIQRNHIIFPGSTNPEHIKSNIDIFDFEIEKEDMDKIKSLDKNKSFDTMPLWLQYPVLFFLGLELYYKK